MTLRRYTSLRPSTGTRWPPEVRAAAWTMQGGCLGPRVGMTEACLGAVELDHIAASHGTGMKSASTLENAALLCGRHHRVKTENGRVWRPALQAWVARQGRALARARESVG